MSNVACVTKWMNN